MPFCLQTANSDWQAARAPYDADCFEKWSNSFALTIRIGRKLDRQRKQFHDVHCMMEYEII